MLAQVAEHTADTDHSSQAHRHCRSAGQDTGQDGPLDAAAAAEAPGVEVQPPRRSFDERLRHRPRGQDALFADVYAEYRPFVRRYIESRVCPAQRGAVEDLTQETFLRLWPYVGEIDRHGGLYGYLGTVARRVMGYHAGLARRAEIAVDPHDELANRDATAAGAAPPSVEERLDLGAAMRSLPAETRQALYHRVVDEEGWSRIGRRLGQNPVRVECAVGDGLARMRDRLGADPAVGEYDGERLRARAVRVAQRYRDEHGALPTGRQLAAIAAVAHGTAETTLRALRHTPTDPATTVDTDEAAETGEQHRTAGQRAEATARDYAQTHGRLPTGELLGQLADVSPTYAREILAPLRVDPSVPVATPPIPRARDYAREHAEAHGRWPTCAALMELAGVSYSTANTALRRERVGDPAEPTAGQRAEAAARNYADTHGRLPTGSVLAELADVSPGYAREVLTPLRAESAEPTGGQRAEAAARDYADTHGVLPTGGVLAELAGISPTYARQVLAPLRGQHTRTPDLPSGERNRSGASANVTTAAGAGASEPPDVPRPRSTGAGHRARAGSEMATPGDDALLAEAHQAVEQLERTARRADCSATAPADTASTAAGAAERQRARIARWQADDHARENHAELAGEPAAAADDELVLTGGINR